MNYLGWIPARWETMKLCFFRSGSTLRKQQIVTIHRYSPPRKSTTGIHATNSSGPVHSHGIATPLNPAGPRSTAAFKPIQEPQTPLNALPPLHKPHGPITAKYRLLTARFLTSTPQQYLQQRNNQVRIEMRIPLLQILPEHPSRPPVACVA